MKFKCPLCGSALSEKHYHNVVKVQQKKEELQKGALEKLQKQITFANQRAMAAKEKERQIRASSKQKIDAAKKATKEKERRKNEQNSKRLIARIKKLEEEKKMLQQHTNPQEIGYADEKALAARLKKEFPEDRIEHEGKGGDVLQYVAFGKEEAGIIVYECKHTDRIQAAHVSQTALAKKTRQAHYGILVTTGNKRGFSGLGQEQGIFIVAQAGAIALAKICRESLVTMAREKLSVLQRAEAAKRLMDYVTSPVCKTPLEEAILKTKQATENLFKDIKRHLQDWKERHEIYQTIHYDVSHIQENIDRVLEGKEPMGLQKPRLEPLALPGKGNN